VKCLLEKQVPLYLVRILHNYLKNRMGYVQVNDNVSRVADIKSGCIQGSILGPYLFCVYMSELSSILVNAKVFSYADDSYIVVTGDDIADVKTKLVKTLGDHFN